MHIRMALTFRPSACHICKNSTVIILWSWVLPYEIADYILRCTALGSFVQYVLAISCGCAALHSEEALQENTLNF